MTITTVEVFGKRKVLLTMELLEGPYEGPAVDQTDRVAPVNEFGRPVQLFWAAPLPNEQGRTAISSKFRRAWELTMGRRPQRGERLTHAALLHHLYLVRVHLVTKNSKGDPLPQQSQYSVISDLLERLA